MRLGRLLSICKIQTLIEYFYIFWGWGTYVNRIKVIFRAEADCTADKRGWVYGQSRGNGKRRQENLKAAEV
jgi:hypothetical protein